MDILYCMETEAQQHFPPGALLLISHHSQVIDYLSFSEAFKITTALWALLFAQNKH
jgi:hypothetical protein